MLRAYRNWLEAEMKLLANASHHAYSFGQANMAKRALAKFDADFDGLVAIDRTTAAAALAALDEGAPLPLAIQSALRTELAAVAPSQGL